MLDGKNLDLAPTPISIMKSNKINILSEKMSDLVLPPAQGVLFRIEKQIKYGGVEMGVMETGLPYLSERGLSRMCGIDPKTLNKLAVNWKNERSKPRGQHILQLLEDSDFHEDVLYLRSEHNGIETNAYTEPVCLALLEYYAFIANPPKKQAIHAFRSLARKTFRTFIYNAVGYAPSKTMLDSWKHFHDRVDMTIDAVPIGYFSVFREISSMIVPMIKAGIIISDKVVPDISVGLTWSKFWQAEKFSEKCGERIKYNHEYPDYYPQSKSNPQSAFAYPDSALGVFRSWLRQHYITNKFPKYLVGQTKKGKLEKSIAARAVEALNPIGIMKK